MRSLHVEQRCVPLPFFHCFAPHKRTPLGSCGSPCLHTHRRRTYRNLLATVEARPIRRALPRLVLLWCPIYESRKIHSNCAQKHNMLVFDVKIPIFCVSSRCSATAKDFMRGLVGYCVHHSRWELTFQRALMRSLHVEQRCVPLPFLQSTVSRRRPCKRTPLGSCGSPCLHTHRRRTYRNRRVSSRR